MSSEQHDHRPDFSTFSSSVVDQMEMATGVPAEALVKESGILTTPAPVMLLDNAAGAGVVTAKLYRHFENKTKGNVKVVVGDVEPKMIELASNRFAEKKEEWGLDIKVVDSQKIDYPDNTFTHVLTNFGVQLIPDQKLALKEMVRVLKPGGLLGFTTWNEPGWMPPLKAIEPTWQAPPVLTGAWATESLIKPELENLQLSLTDIRVVPCDFETVFNEVESDKMLGLLNNLLRGFLTPERLEKLKEEIRKTKKESGEPVMKWKSFVVLATKSSE